MKITRFFELLMLLITFNATISSRLLITEDVTDLFSATAEVLTKGFRANAVTINFIIALSDETKVKHSIMIDNLISSCSATSSVYMEDVNAITQRQRLYNVIFIDKIESFRRLFSQMMNKSDNFVIDGYYLLVFTVNEGFIDGRLDEITTKLWTSLSIQNVLILIQRLDDERNLSLMTFFPFSSSIKCDDTTPVTINNFTNGKFQNNKFFLPKTKNMSQCPIKVVSFNCPPLMMISYDNQNNIHLDGIDGKMIKVISDTLNFKIDFIHFDDNIR